MNPKTVFERKDYIHGAFREIDKNQSLRHTMCQSVLERCEEC